METDSNKCRTFPEQKENTFYQIFRFLPDAVLLMRGSDKVVLDINAAGEKLTGYKREEIVGQTSLEMVFFLDPDLWNRIFEQHDMKIAIRDIETRIRSKDSTIVNVKISIDRIESDGQLCYLTTLRHINEQEATKTTTAKPQPQTDVGIEYLFSPEVDINREEVGRLIDFKAIQEMMGSFYKATHIGMAITDLKGEVHVATGWQDICTKFHRIHPETLAYCKESDIYLTQNLSEGQYRLYKCKNNLWDIATPIIINGRHIANLFLGQFIFEDEVHDYEFFRRQANRYGFDQKEYLAALDAVPRWTRETVYNVMDFYSKLAVMISRLSIGNIQLAQSLKRQNHTEAELKKHRDHLEDLIAERTAQLAVAKDKAESANRAKSVFLANMSHELRTPLNAVLGFSQLIKNSPDLPSSQRGHLEIITHSGEHLLRLINNVLDIAKIESGRVELEESPIVLWHLVEEMRSLMSVQATGKGLSFTVVPAPDLPRYVAVDGGKLRQVLLNLIGNAIKYTEKGGVILRVMATKEEGAERMRVRFEIEDTGPGIREEDRGRIFSSFVQLGDQPTLEAGTGLGLAISKQYVELMGGTIGVAAAPKEGSVFHFEIPVAVLPDEAILAAPLRDRVIGLADGQPRSRLLIAEDQPENRLLLRELLEPIGFELREAINGQQAVAVAEQWRPHLIFMDIRMPVMDGLEATRQIKATEAGAHIRIVAITAHALEEELGEILAAGCDDFIRKPYRDVEIFDALTKYLGVRFVYEEDVIPSAAGATQPDMASLATLPKELLDALEHALHMLDIREVGRAIEDIYAHDAPVADELADMARDFQYSRILRLIRAAHAKAGSEDSHV